MVIVGDSDCRPDILTKFHWQSNILLMLFVDRTGTFWSPDNNVISTFCQVMLKKTEHAKEHNFNGSRDYNIPVIVSQGCHMVVTTL